MEQLESKSLELSIYLPEKGALSKQTFRKLRTDTTYDELRQFGRLMTTLTDGDLDCMYQIERTRIFN